MFKEYAVQIQEQLSTGEYFWAFSGYHKLPAQKYALKKDAEDAMRRLKILFPNNTFRLVEREVHNWKETSRV